MGLINKQTMMKNVSETVAQRVTLSSWGHFCFLQLRTVPAPVRILKGSCFSYLRCVELQEAVS